MTKEELVEWKRKVEQARTLLPRLDSGDELHREAATEIRRLKQMYEQDMRDAVRDAQNAYQEGQCQGREQSEDRW